MKDKLGRDFKKPQSWQCVLLITFVASQLKNKIYNFSYKFFKWVALIFFQI